ncbi:MAG: hypothetical protein M0R06_16060 [Sphaerochaeta sp.]|jgi:hypothetical protein|nr:hypothetical protein [Sphaerochaeta sp.]
MKKALFFLWMIVFLLCSTGCTQEEKEFIFENYGMENAFRNKNGHMVTLQNPSGTIYYGQTNDVKYREAAVFACDELSTVNGIFIQVVFDSQDPAPFKYRATLAPAGCNPLLCPTHSINMSVPNSSYYVAKFQPSWGGAYGAQYVGATITMNRSYTDYYQQAALNHVALHEFAHTFGLDDLYDNEAKGYTIMYGVFDPYSTPILSELSEFDRANLGWAYDPEFPD